MFGRAAFCRWTPALIVGALLLSGCGAGAKISTAPTTPTQAERSVAPPESNGGGGSEEANKEEAEKAKEEAEEAKTEAEEAKKEAEEAKEQAEEH